MKIICAWCNRLIGENALEPAPGLPRDAVSHGLCPDCKKRLVSEAAQAEETFSLDELEACAEQKRKERRASEAVG